MVKDAYRRASGSAGLPPCNINNGAGLAGSAGLPPCNINNDAGRKPCAPGLALPALAAALVAALALSARGGGVAVPLPVHADMEASAALALAAPGARDRSLTVMLSLEASAANNAEAAFFAAGCGDVPAAVIGWDCGEWFVAGGRLRERLAAAAASAGGVPGAQGFRPASLILQGG
ncbi:MAG: hypothetical protein FWG50_13680, partial [Kiritimatiellaeota bacterium]|nr:hypothetical protein [Kiritimatiellota bacterium]